MDDWDQGTYQCSVIHKNALKLLCVLLIAAKGSCFWWKQVGICLAQSNSKRGNSQWWYERRIWPLVLCRWHFLLGITGGKLLLDANRIMLNC